VVAAVAEAEVEAKATAQKMNWLQGAWRLQGFTKKSREDMSELQVLLRGTGRESLFGFLRAPYIKSFTNLPVLWHAKHGPLLSSKTSSISRRLQRSLLGAYRGRPNYLFGPRENLLALHAACC